MSTRAMHHCCTKIKHNTHLNTQYWLRVPEGAISSIVHVMTVVPISNIPGV